MVIITKIKHIVREKKTPSKEPLLFCKWYNLHPEKNMLFLNHIKQQINKYLSIFNFKYVVFFAYENWAIFNV